MKASKLRTTGLCAGATAVTVAVAAAGSPMVFADEVPQRALQSVEVRLGTDGAITGLSSTLVSATRDQSDTTTRRLDPSEHAADLPVRVTTAWAHDGRVGTDLADLDGVDGRVEITLTVQNTTLHAERFQYDAGGQPRDAYELVATPLTVLASTSLPDEAFADVVQAVPGTAEPGTTNGVVSSDGSGTTVSWASLLAPPRLPAATTFTLVQDAEDFEVPEFTLSVRPGLAADASLARVVSDLFGGADDIVASENNTIGLIANINATLAQVADSLALVQQTLAVNAGQVGTAATRTLTSTASDLDASSQAVLRDLEALDGSVASTVESANGQAVGALQTSIQSVLDYFGTPTTGPGDQPQAAACGADPQVAEPAGTLLGQLSQVSTQLRQLSDAGEACVEALRASLRTTIGEDGDCLDAEPVAGGRGKKAPLVCQLQGAGAELVDLAVDLQEQSLAIVQAVDTAAVDTVGLRVDELVQAVVAVQAAGQRLDPKLDGGAVDALLGVLTDLDEAIAAAEAAAGSASTDGVEAELRALAALAQERVADLAGDPDAAEGGTGTSATAQLTKLADSICAVDVTGDSDAAAQLDALRQLVDGAPCGGGPKAGTGDPVFTKPLTERVAGHAAAWREVLDATDVDAATPDGAAASLAELDGQLDRLRTEVTALRALVDDATEVVTGSVDPAAPLTGKPLRTALSELVAQLEALYDPTVAADGCAADPDDSAPPLNRLAASFAVVDCNTDTLAGRLQTLLAGVEADVRAAGEEDLQQAADDAAATGQEGDDALNLLAGTLTGQLDAAADRQEEQGRAVVAAQRARLDAVRAAAEQDLDTRAQEAIGRLAEEVARAGSQQSSAAAALQAQMQKVLLDLGSASQGRGLLGVIQNSAGQTGVRAAQVEQAGTHAASFRGVRLAELADAQLEQQQLARSLQSAQRFGAFAEELPDGSTSTTVFVLHLGEES